MSSRSDISKEIQRAVMFKCTQMNLKRNISLPTQLYLEPRLCRVLPKPCHSARVSYAQDINASLMITELQSKA